MRPLSIIVLLVVILISLTYAALVVKMEKGGLKGAKRKREIKNQINEIARNRKSKSKKDEKGNGLLKKREKVDKKGKHTRMQQTYHDIPVLGAEIVQRRIKKRTVNVRSKKTKKPTGEKREIKAQTKLRGCFVEDIDKDIPKVAKTKLKPKKALRILKKKFKDALDIRECTSETAIHINEKSEKAQIVYIVNCYVTNKNKTLTRPTMMMDDKFRVILEWDDVRYAKIGRGPGGNAKLGPHEYGNDRPKIEVTQVGTDCIMDTPDVTTYNHESCNYHGNLCFLAVLPWKFTCDWFGGTGRLPNNIAPSHLNDAHYNAQRSVDMYKEWYEDGIASPFANKVKVRVHILDWYYANYYINAAYFPDSDLGCWFGDGYDYKYGRWWFYPLGTGLDVVAHEIAHQLTNEQSNLRYVGQSGALSESFSDMAGKAAEFFERATVNWQIGEDVFRWTGGGIRCMNDPKCVVPIFGASIDHVADYPGPAMDVHKSSGIFNKVFYELAQKWPYGVWDAFDVFYVSNMEFWGRDTGFADGAADALNALREMKQCIHMDYCYEWLLESELAQVFANVGITCTKGTSWSCNPI